MKDVNINIRVSEEVKREIREEADKLGLTTTAYLTMLHRKHTNEGGRTMKNNNTITKVSEAKGYQQMISIPVRRGATTKEMADLLAEDFTFNDAFGEILLENDETVQEWVERQIREGWLTIEDGNLTVWIENF